MNVSLLHRCTSKESICHSLVPWIQLCIIFVGAAWTYQGMFALHIFGKACVFHLGFHECLFRSRLCLLTWFSSASILSAVQSEDKVKPVLVVPGHLQALEHVVRQDYFPKENVAVLQAFMSR